MANKRIGNIIYDNYDAESGYPFTTKIINQLPDGTPVTDALVDNKVIFKNQLRNGGGYSVRTFDVGQSKTLVVNNIEAIRNLTKSDILMFRLGIYTNIRTEGYYEPNDGGGFEYLYNSSSIAPDDGFLKIRPTLMAIGGFFPNIKGDINVKIAGLKGDNEFDNTDKLRMISSSSDGISKYFWPKGIYLISDQITPSGDLHWVGENRALTIIKYKDNTAKVGASANNIMIYFSAVSNVTFEEITIDANGENQLPEVIRNSCVHLQNASTHFKFKRCVFMNARTGEGYTGGYGISDFGADDVEVEGCHFENNGQSDIALFEGQRWNIVNNTSKDTGYVPINIELEPSSTKFIKTINVDGWIAENVGMGILTVIENGLTGSVEDVTVSNLLGTNIGYLLGRTVGAVRVRGTKRTTIRNVNIDGCRQYGLRVTTDANRDVVDLTVEDFIVNYDVAEGEVIQQAVSLEGSATNPIKNAKLGGVRVNNSPVIAFDTRYCDNLKVTKSFLINTKTSYALNVQNCNGVTLDDVTVNGGNSYLLHIFNSRNVRVSGGSYLNGTARGIYVGGTSDHITIGTGVHIEDNRTTKLMTQAVFVETTTPAPHISIMGNIIPSFVTTIPIVYSISSKENVLESNNIGVGVGSRPFKLITENYTALPIDQFLVIDNIASTVVKIPTAASVNGKSYTFKKVSADGIAYRVSVEIQAGGQIDGASRVLLNRKGDSVTIYSDGTRWNIIDRVIKPAAGTHSVAGTGQTSFGIPHGMGGVTPTYTNVTPKNAAARSAGITSWIENETNIIVTITTPNTGGTLEYAWEAIQ